MPDPTRRPACCAPSASQAMPAGNTDVHVARLKALAHPVRLRIVDLLREGERCACDFEAYFDLTQPTISHHLKVLREAGLLHGRQEGSWIHYSLDADAFAGLRALLDALTPRHEPA